MPPSGPRVPHNAIQPVGFEPTDRRRKVGPTRSRRGLLLILVLLAPLILVAWYVFAAKAVLVTVTPGADSVEVTDRRLQFRLDERILLLPGKVTLLAKKEGYYDLTETVEVGAAASQEFNLLLKKLPGRVRLALEPAVDATVRIDGAEPRAVPAEPLELSAGSHELEVFAERYQPGRATVDVEGARVLQTVALSLVPNWADIELISEPAGAEVRVDGELLGTTPLVAQIDAGRREVTLSLKRHKRWVEPLTVVATEARTLGPIKLLPSDGRARISSTPPGAVVTIAGNFRGNTPLALQLPPGRAYSIAFSKLGFAEQKRQLRVVADDDASLHVELAPLVGSVKIEIVPADAQVFVAGRKLQDGSGVLELQAMPTEIEFRRAGYASVRKKVTPRPGTEQLLRVELLTEREALLASLPKLHTASDGNELILIPAGTVRLGSSRRERGHRANEVRREATLKLPFYLAKTEVTNAQFRQFRPEHNSGSVYAVSLDGSKLPVVNVTWQQATEYCNWLSARENLPPVYQTVRGTTTARDPPGPGYRLPFESEWVWAARYSATAGAETAFPLGAAGSGEKLGNYADVLAAGLATPILREYNDGSAATAAVGSYPPSPLGLFDLSGNAAEWVSDTYSFNPGETTTPELVLDLHVIRGASWMHGSFGQLRWAYRDYGDEPRPDLSFRIAKGVL